MIRVIPIPSATATATEQQFVVEVEKALCRRVCVNGAQLQGTVQFTAGTPSEINGVAVVQIYASGNISTLDRCGGNKMQRNFLETFNVPLTATAENTVTLTPGEDHSVEYADICCCHSGKAVLTTTLTVAIA